ncbi:hypothetical protein B0T20DRAFT_359777 [Sordaria brevicollis]|uniref:Uncharacterized protein n=1 Tax=Sordaria brevicollis TaxID=83679 RepID=A0AAE0P9K6_SORBR|nr:hypothetical protein B0T20DRAFT_359777 [Sordaria brevicollis]
MCFTYRIAESMDSHLNLSMLSLALEKATPSAEVDFPSVYCFQSTPFETQTAIPIPIPDIGDAENDSSSGDEFFDAPTGEEELEWLNSSDTKDVQSHSTINDDWIQTFWEQDEDETAYTYGTNDHPIAGWHSPRLIRSDWTKTNFIDKTDHIDFWSRHTQYTLSKCTWCTLSVDSWPKPKNDSPCGAPDLMLVTPEGEVCWLDDPFDYESLPWEREVAGMREVIVRY